MHWVRAAIAATFMIGCSPPAQQATAPAQPASPVQSPTTQSPEELPMFQWLSGEGTGRAWLYFGPDESDNIHMHFTCIPGSGVVTAEAFDPRREGAQLVLASGHVSRAFPATPIRDETGDFFGDAVKSQAEVATSEPVISSFRQSGALSSGDPGTTFRTATAQELERIQRFFARCEA